MMPNRCGWVTPGDALYEAYHDTEWGVPVRDGRSLFSKLCLDGLQAGLSWRVILHKRDALNEIFDHFDPERLVRWGSPQFERVLGDASGIRSVRKASGMVKNAQAYLGMQERGEDFAELIWASVGGTVKVNAWQGLGDVPAATPEGDALAKALKKRGFTFCGPVITYAFMQAVGIVNDHVTDCHRYEACCALR
jgi:DNA-3-methyladenine glycosylase I